MKNLIKIWTKNILVFFTTIGGFAPNIVSNMNRTDRFRLALASFGIIITSCMVSLLYAYGFSTFSDISIGFWTLFLGFFTLILLVDQVILSGDDSPFLTRLRWTWVLTLGTICGFFWISIWFQPTAKQVLAENLRMSKDSINLKYDDYLSPLISERQTIDSLVMVNQNASTQKFDKVFLETEKGMNGRPAGYGKIATELDILYQRDSVLRAPIIASYVTRQNDVNDRISDMERKRDNEIDHAVRLNNEKGLLKTVSAIDSYIFNPDSPWSDRLFYFAVHLMAFLLEMLVFGIKSGFKTNITAYRNYAEKMSDKNKDLFELKVQMKFDDEIQDIQVNTLRRRMEYDRRMMDMKIDYLKSIGPEFKSTLSDINQSVASLKREFEEDEEMIDKYYTQPIKEKMNKVFSDNINYEI